MDINKVLNDIVNEFSKIDYVDAVVLSGSRTSAIYDESSDYDVYVYAKESLPLDVRKNIAEKFTQTFKVGNTFFEDGDEWNLPNSKGIDIMYRQLQWIKDEIDSVWNNHNAKVGYSTCFLHNVKTSKILFDRNGEFKALQEELYKPYPEKLSENIIAKNYPLLRDKDASFYDQIKLAQFRKDTVSLAHRTTAILTSYFDILFAINKQTHPGEKKLVAYCEMLCMKLPKNFKNDVETVVKSITTDNLLPAIDKLIDELDKVI